MTLQHRPGLGGLFGRFGRGARLGPATRSAPAKAPLVHAPGFGPGPYTAATRASFMRHAGTLTASTVGPKAATAGSKIRTAAGDTIRAGGRAGSAARTSLLGKPGRGAGTRPSGNLRGGPGFGG